MGAVVVGLGDVEDAAVVVEVVDGSQGTSRVVSPPARGVVDVGGAVPSVVLGPVAPSAPIAPLASGPPRLAAVIPPPASTESTVRHDGRREPTRCEPPDGGLSEGFSW